jgi:hypothetical protein
LGLTRCGSDSPKCHQLDVTAKGGMCDGVVFRGGMCGPSEVADVQMGTQITRIGEIFGARFTISEYNRLKQVEYEALCCKVNAACKSGGGPSPVKDIPFYVEALKQYQAAEAVVAEAEKLGQEGPEMVAKIRASKVAELAWKKADAARVAYCQAQMEAMMYCTSDNQCAEDVKYMESRPGQTIADCPFIDDCPPFATCCSALELKYQLVCTGVEESLLSTQMLRTVCTGGRVSHVLRAPGRETRTGRKTSLSCPVTDASLCVLAEVEWIMQYGEGVCREGCHTRCWFSCTIPAHWAAGGRHCCRFCAGRGLLELNTIKQLLSRFSVYAKST